jgi:hypothetical protein
MGAGLLSRGNNQGHEECTYMYVTGSGLPSLFVTQFILESSYGTNEFVLVQSCFRFHVCITAYQ